MPGRSPLKGRAPRLLDHHGGMEGRAYRKAYDGLEAMFGPFRHDFIRFEAGCTAVARLQLERSTRELVMAQRKRRVGRGRKPNERQIERLARRQGLADGTYAAAVKRLEELMQRTALGHDLASQLAAPLHGRMAHERV